MTALLLSEPEAAARLHISPRLLRDLRKHGEIRYVALSARRIAYREEDCAEYIANRVRKAEPCPEAKPKPSVQKRAGSSNIIPFSQLTGR